MQLCITSILDAAGSLAYKVATWTWVRRYSSQPTRSSALLTCECVQCTDWLANACNVQIEVGRWSCPLPFAVQPSNNVFCYFYLSTLLLFLLKYFTSIWLIPLVDTSSTPHVVEHSIALWLCSAGSSSLCIICYSVTFLHCVVFLHFIVVLPRPFLPSHARSATRVV